MSHSKIERQPIEDRLPKFKKWIVACTACGQKGRSETFDPAALSPMHPNVLLRFERAYELLPLDELGRCPECSAVASARER